MSNSSFSVYLRTLLIGLGVIVYLFGCNNSQNHNNKAEKMGVGNLNATDATGESIRKIKDRRILFAHHSVGENILDGLQIIAVESGVDLKITRIGSAPLTNKSTFVDFTPGNNQSPKTKIDGFVQQIKNLNKDFVPDIAFMKFCYVDFGSDTDIEELFEYYKNNIEVLKKERPEIAFAHLTVPLVAKPENFKSSMKRLLRLEVWEDASNVNRTRFNQLLIKEFPEDPIFDIARIESTRMDGSRAEFKYDGITYYSLATEYTHDGGHLNVLGRRVVASEMAKFLANTFYTNEKIHKK